MVDGTTGADERVLLILGTENWGGKEGVRQVCDGSWPRRGP